MRRRQKKKKAASAAKKKKAAEDKQKAEAAAAKPKKAEFKTVEDAKSFLEYSIPVIEEPANKKLLLETTQKLKAAAKNEMDFKMEAMGALPPILWKMIGSEMEKYGYSQSNMLVGLMHLNKHAESDKKIKSALDKLQAYLEF